MPGKAPRSADANVGSRWLVFPASFEMSGRTTDPTADHGGTSVATEVVRPCRRLTARLLPGSPRPSSPWDWHLVLGHHELEVYCAKSRGLHGDAQQVDAGDMSDRNSLGQMKLFW